MISYDEALALVLENATTLGIETLPINDASNRVLAADIICPFCLPRFDNSAVDGYALGEGREIEEWRVVRTIGAGDRAGPELGPGECARIYTGAPVPPGTSTVVMQEDVEILPDNIVSSPPAIRGQNIRRAGEELAEGDVALSAGTPLNAAGVGVAATIGLTSVSVYRTPRVGILVTGSELAPLGSELSGACVYESNSVVLTAGLKSLGLSPTFVEHVGDSVDESVVALRQAIENCDVLITTGGVSVGDRDLVRKSLEQLGVGQVFWKVAIKPGKPVYHGTVGNKAVFGLPGNPLSVLTTFTLLVRPFLLSKLGFPNPNPIRFLARLSDDITHKPGRREFLPGLLESSAAGPVIVPISGQGSHMLTGMAKANALIDIPSEVNGIRANEFVSVVMI